MTYDQMKDINDIPAVMFVWVYTRIMAFRHASYKNTYVISSNVEICVYNTQLLCFLMRNSVLV